MPIIGGRLASEQLAELLPGDMQFLSNSNIITINLEYWDAGMNKLGRFLQKPVDA